MLTLFPAGGLCNRLLAIHSSLHLSRDIQQPLRVVWRMNPELGCRFDRLFRVPGEISQFINLETRKPSIARKIRELPFRYFHWPPLRPSFQWQEIEALHKAGYDFSAFSNRRHTQFESLSLFYGEDRPFYGFQPADTLSDRIKGVLGGDTEIIGIHIRRTDHKLSIQHSHTDLFAEKIEAIVRKNYDQKFFLATDDPQEEAKLLRLFPRRISTFGKRSQNRSREEAIEDALVDLYCLSRTRKILGSYASTFSFVAGWIGGVPVEYVHSRSAPC